MRRNESTDVSERFEYLQTLVTEFQDTDSEGKKKLLSPVTVVKND